MALNVLVVDDDEAICNALHDVLSQAGHDATVAFNGAEGLRQFFSSSPDLVIMDVRMPQMDGWTLLERIREVSDIPVIMLTVLGDQPEVVRGLRGGADDYLEKPFGGEELLARIDAVTRRLPSKPEIRDVYQDSELTIEFGRRRVTIRGSEARLSSLEFKLLTALVHSSGNALSAKELVQACWGNREGSPERLRIILDGFAKSWRGIRPDPFSLRPSVSTATAIAPHKEPLAANRGPQ